MRPRAFPILLLLATLALPARALETDQFTVPPAPLKDLGPQLQSYFDSALDRAIAQVNTDFDRQIRAAADTDISFFRDRDIARAADCLREDAIPNRLRWMLAQGLPECTVEKHIRSLGDHFEISPGDGVYGRWLLDRPITLMELSPTVNLFGVYCGTDKIGHFFQQGYECYAIYLDHERDGDTPAAARAAAVAHCVSQEKGIFGELLVGVYSNADLAADYAGLNFYLNLTRTVRVSAVDYPPILRKISGHWQRNPAAPSDSLRPYFSDHFNEARNPSRYVPGLRKAVRDNLRGPRASAWMTFYHSTPAAELQKTQSLSTWYGQSYGHSGFTDIITLPSVLLDSTARANSPNR